MPSFIFCIDDMESKYGDQGFVSRKEGFMIINSSNVFMDSSRSYSSESVRKSITLMGNEITVNQSSVKKNEREGYFRDALKLEMIDDATGDMEKSLLGMKTGNSSNVRRFDASSHENAKKIREQSLLFLIRFLYNRLWRDKDEKADILEYANAQNSNAGISSGNDVQGNVIGFSRKYYSYSEYEETSFETSGKVITADGREIDFGIEMVMSRSFTESYFSEQDIYAMTNSPLVDPLVINLDNNGVGVSDQKFYFDIDSDGILDSLSRLGSSSGYLALDLNDDGIINDGSELFGTKSGNGFVDLSMYDEDGNGWIDEADSIFSKLLIWTKDENGKDMLYTLKDKGVGALCLQSVNTNFDLKSLKDNTTNAKVRSSGVFLYENGNVGSLQQIDLAK